MAKKLRPRYENKIAIECIENGWLIHYKNNTYKDRQKSFHAWDDVVAFIKEELTREPEVWEA